MDDFFYTISLAGLIIVMDLILLLGFKHIVTSYPKESEKIPSLPPKIHLQHK